MALAETANMLAALTLKDGFTGPLKKMDSSLSKFDAHLAKTSNRGFKAGQQIGTGIRNAGKIAAVGIGFLAAQVAFGLDSLSKLEDAEAQTEAVLKSTGDSAGVSAKQVRGLAESYENLNATIDDKVIQSAENLLLTFTNVKKDAFEPALGAILDMNEALGRGEGGLQTSVTQVGKALNDPTKGITALRRAGVQFTDQQVKQIKALQKSGDLLGAQRIVLGELSKEFGGSFAAKGKTATATVAGIGDAAEDLQKTVASGLFPIIQKLLPKIRAALADPALLSAVGKLGDTIASLFSDDNIREGTRIIGDFFNSAKNAAPTLQRAAEVTGSVLKTSIDLFRSLPPEIQALAISGLAVNKLTGGLVTNLAGGLISAVISSFRGLMNVNAGVVNVNGPVAGVPGVPGGGGGTGIIGTAAKFVIPVAVASIAVGAAKVLTDAIDPTLAAALNDPTGAHGTPLGNRDPRRFNANGQVVQNVLQNIAKTEDRSYDAIERVRQAAFRTTQAVKDQDSSVTVNNRVLATTILNGRVLQANVERFTTKVDSGAPSGAFGGQ